ncbi:type II toxin-antitoxin system Phd/YefM family antitoxin [Phycicoccus sonneratiae]|uniref:Prevent-host-death protein n=1 Tax=Phycicoccus sonneratiae TaxID=2807628 RepID=A0ABS2CU22_9MICO|nr:prevent-host-death protein [Phycicoccus sonneraticus]MBM6402579.1 prevent-host-death protein [Phycicoccus sonneraticus]
MSEVISQRELRNDSGRIMRGLEEGRTFVITRRSEPVGELRPLRRRRFVDAAMLSEVFAGSPEIDAARFRADVDQVLDQDVEPRG